MTAIVLFNSSLLVSSLTLSEFGDLRTEAGLGLWVGDAGSCDFSGLVLSFRVEVFRSLVDLSALIFLFWIVLGEPMMGDSPLILLMNELTSILGMMALLRSAAATFTS